MDFFCLFNEAYIQHRRPREFKERINFSYDHADFVQRFRLSQETVHYLEERIGHHLQRNSNRNHALTPSQQILTSLRFLATNGFYHLIRDSHGPSESSVCVVLKDFVRVVNENLFDEVVRWPENCVEFSNDFFNMHGIPSVCGLIDGTLIRIKKPSEHEENFVDRHGNHSINAMLVSGPQHQFVYCNSSWLGSVNDARALRNSSLSRKFNNNYRPFPGAIILGDSIYLWHSVQ